MTRLYEIGTDDPYPDRKSLRSFTWTHEAISDWEDVWHDLWHLGYKWEWQDYDRYARRYGDHYNLFGCHGDAARLDMAIPLPGVAVIQDILDSLLRDPRDDAKLDHAVSAIDRWLKKHYAPA